MNRTHAKRAFQLLFGASLLVAFACAVENNGTDTNSGGDHKRDLAKKIPLGRTVTDSVSAPKGDHTDWKYIDIAEEGTLKVTVSVDNPNVAGTVLLYDELGEPIQRAIINPQQNSYDFEIQVEAGKKYFIRTQVSKYETVYSVGNVFTKKEAAAVVEIKTEEPKPTPVAQPVYKPRRTAAPKETVKDEPKEDPTKIVVTTVILNVIPWKEGKAARITFKQGADEGIKRGATVAISTGGSCNVKEVFPATSVCVVEKSPESFKEGTQVVITSER